MEFSGSITMVAQKHRYQSGTMNWFRERPIW